MSGRRGDWMQTYTGRAFWPLDPREEEIDPLDIAHALSMLCRYGGHVRRFYSVAEHCVLMSYAVPPEHALWALLHDATEAYMVDLPRPIKRHMREYRVAENRLMESVCARFGLERYGFAGEMPASVKDADNRILLDERAALLGPCELRWNAELEALPLLGVKIHGWSPRRAERKYLARLNELTR